MSIHTVNFEINFLEREKEKTQKIIDDLTLEHKNHINTLDAKIAELKKELLIETQKYNDPISEYFNGILNTFIPTGVDNYDRYYFSFDKKTQYNYLKQMYTTYKIGCKNNHTENYNNTIAFKYNNYILNEQIKTIEEFKNKYYTGMLRDDNVKFHKLCNIKTLKDSSETSKLINEFFSEYNECDIYLSNPKNKKFIYITDNKTFLITLTLEYSYYNIISTKHKIYEDEHLAGTMLCDTIQMPKFNKKPYCKLSEFIKQYKEIIDTYNYYFVENNNETSAGTNMHDNFERDLNNNELYKKLINN